MKKKEKLNLLVYREFLKLDNQDVRESIRFRPIGTIETTTIRQKGNIYTFCKTKLRKL